MQIRSFREAARELGINRVAITTLVRIGKIATVPHPSNGRALGLDPANFALLRKLLARKATAAAK